MALPFPQMTSLVLAGHFPIVSIFKCDFS